MFGVSCAIIVKSTLLLENPTGNPWEIRVMGFPKGHPGEVRHMVFDEADTLCETWPGRTVEPGKRWPCNDQDPIFRTEVATVP